MAKRTREPVILVHGGAGRYAEGRRGAVCGGCEQAARAGFAVFARGGSALDAAVAAVCVLEDDPQFNAGTGSVLNSAGEIEMDASVMDGHLLRAGAVAAVSRLKHPVLLARAVMDEDRHVLLAADGALRFAREIGMNEVPEAALRVERQARRWHDKHGTVGAVARDGSGHLAAATSTGGIFDKRPGRVGDSALIGCGTYADDHAAVSCTGVGEAIIRTVLAHTAAEAVRAGASAQRAARRAVSVLARKTRATGGLIVIDAQGRVGYARTTERMAVAYIVGDERLIASDW